MAPIWLVEISKLPALVAACDQLENRWALRDREMRVADAGRAADQDVSACARNRPGRHTRGPRGDELVCVLRTTSGAVAPDAAAIDRGYERASLDRNPE